MFHQDVIDYIESGEYLKKYRPDLEKHVEEMKLGGYIVVTALPNRAILTLTPKCRLKLTGEV